MRGVDNFLKKFNFNVFLCFVIVILIIAICIFFTIKKNNNNAERKDEVLSQKDLIETAQTREKDNQKESKEITNVIFPKECTYQNVQAGYTIKFPEHWGGNYVVTEYGPNKVCIGFFGESKTGQILYKERFGHYGLDMCWIVTEVSEEGCLLWCELGEINGEKYFITSPLGGTYLPELSEILKEDSVTRRMASYVVDEVELQLAVKDNNIATQMRTDLDEMNIKFESMPIE